MTNEQTNERWRELSWRQRPTPAQQAELRAWLAEHPEALADWQAEAALNQALDQLPDAPVPGNFTALVLQALERETAAAASRPRFSWLAWRPRLRWLPKMAVVAIFLGVSLLSYHQVLAIQPDAISSVMLVEHQPASVRGGGFGQL